MVHPTSDTAIREVIVFLEHVPVGDKAFRRIEGRRSAGTRLLPARTAGKKVFSLECKEAVDLTLSRPLIGSIDIVTVFCFENKN